MILITEAAKLAHISKSAFVADAARLAAQRVIARSDTTLMASELFDSMMAALDTPDDAPGLAEIAALPRLIASDVCGSRGTQPVPVADRCSRRRRQSRVDRLV